MSGSAVNVTQTLTAERDADGKPFARLVCTRCARAGGDSHAMLAQNGQVNLDKDRIHLWEFLNEPVYTSYALPSDREGKLGGKRYTPADYVALLEVAAKGMREADPACKVMGGIAGPPRTLTREVIEAGCLKHVDIFNLHVYPGKRMPESYAGEMKDLVAMMDAHGGRKPIWMTEFSYYGADKLPRRPFFFSREQLGRRAAVGQRAPMRRLHRAILPGDALARGGEAVHPLRRQRPGERPELRMRIV